MTSKKKQIQSQDSGEQEIYRQDFNDDEEDFDLQDFSVAQEDPEETEAKE